MILKTETVMIKAMIEVKLTNWKSTEKQNDKNAFDEVAKSK